ncbi:ATP-binding protein [Agromyces archimandritae]|uniref:ATP-binding protein n=1 Tax=Agromyces archimandritae TaxID=2781962 RepID=A0A975IPU6_9MICO|nr:ATP-binding protein [Agromyces archimandritae]QTX05977.1 ATP-binding protein [Agromyces archimandritae]
MTLNPFRPTAGAEPPQLIGRAGVLDEFEYGLRIRSGAPGLLTIFTGARGVGKTVMLGEAEDAARRAGWAVISETATRGFLGRIGAEMKRLIEELGAGPSIRRITGIGFGGFSVQTELAPEQQAGWRQLGEELLRLLDERGTGLVITLDEIHGADRDELAQLAASVQHFIRAGLPIALVFAGLPAAVSDLLDEGVATFLRRADRIDLHAATVDDVAASYLETFGTFEHPLPPTLVREAAEATGGFPFLIQLVGYHLWQVAETTPGPLSAAEVGVAIAAARRRNSRVVIDAALASASQKDLAFLRAMAVDDGPSKTADLGKRLGDPSNAIGNYRARLIDAGLIESAGRGLVDFAVPGLRERMRA